MIGGFVDALNLSPNSFTALASGFTFRTLLLSGILSNPNRKFCRVTFQSQNVTNGLTVDAAYVGLQAAAGDAYDASVLVPLLFGGSAGFSIGINTTKVSDVAILTVPSATAMLVTGHISASSGLGGRAAVGTGNRLYFKAAVNEAATLNVTGYTASTDGTIWPVIRVEVATDPNFQDVSILGL